MLRIIFFYVLVLHSLTRIEVACADNSIESVLNMEEQVLLSQLSPIPELFQKAHLPTITPYKKFDRDYIKETVGGNQVSRVFNLNDFLVVPLPDLGPNMQIGYINGMNNDFDFCLANAQYAASLASHNIHGVYNQTHGVFIDFEECRLNYEYVATTPVFRLFKLWDAFFKKASADANYLILCHSQGVMHVKNALLSYSGPKHRIFVVAIAPASYIFKETCANVIHYLTPEKNDVIPYYDKIGLERAMLENTVTILPVPQGAGVFTHAFQNISYKKSLNARINAYIKSKGRSINCKGCESPTHLNNQSHMCSNSNSHKGRFVTVNFDPGTAVVTGDAVSLKISISSPGLHTPIVSRSIVVSPGVNVPVNFPSLKVPAINDEIYYVEVSAKSSRIATVEMAPLTAIVSLKSRRSSSVLTIDPLPPPASQVGLPLDAQPVASGEIFLSNKVFKTPIDE